MFLCLRVKLVIRQMLEVACGRCDFNIYIVSFACLRSCPVGINCHWLVGLVGFYRE